MRRLGAGNRATGIWREFSDADRAYRAAFRRLTSRGGPGHVTRTSFAELLASTERLQAVAALLLASREDDETDRTPRP